MVPIRSTTPRSPKAALVAAKVASPTRRVASSSVQKPWTAASSSCMASGVRRSAMASITASGRPAPRAMARCACHMNWQVHSRATSRMASSFSRSGSEELKRVCSPKAWANCPMAGLRSSTL
ncbi:Hypothetical protein Rta_00200 [Ramlibacter tataouinensis TTB310]|uniref:Uncharacterized protein n=1 Tax=Ramlibacter tataouinensis (strain ATCC BAA-407 / DSM 14655 / LMG 21543 / TTB310) TaxID=365046 RepID=F5Y2A6_RAMTT|nr:Hypothetical protein Rta_00200 [Ramlibacter tataouinensis TTB310]